MGEAYYCDRCKKLYDEAEVKSCEIVISGAFNEDLERIFCEECKGHIEGFISGDDLK